MAMLRNRGVGDNPVYGLLQFFKKGNQVDIYVEHNDLDAMLRAEAAGGEIRQDFIEDVEDDVDDNMNSCGSVFVRADRGDEFDISSGSDDSEFRSSDESEGLLDEEYDMDDDDTLFDLNVDHGLENDGIITTHTQFFSSNVHDQLNASDGDIDLDCGDDVLKSDNDSDASGADDSQLSSFPKFNSVIDSRHPKFEIGMLFSSREELRMSLIHSILKMQRDINALRNEKSS
ncbi:hypothetical protein Leryth_003822 [Lithospermum erythrorhizon]|nr:hypothetical protein Leryth_003822 [Lithospermum erythrorhizon]